MDLTLIYNILFYLPFVTFTTFVFPVIKWFAIILEGGFTFVYLDFVKIILSYFIDLFNGQNYIFNLSLVYQILQNIGGKMGTLFPFYDGDFWTFDIDCVDEFCGLVKFFIFFLVNFCSVESSVSSLNSFTELYAFSFLFFGLPFIFKVFFFHKFNFIYNLSNIFIDLETYFQPRGFQFPESYNMYLMLHTHNIIFGYCVFIFLFVIFFLIVTLAYYISIQDDFFYKNHKTNKDVLFKYSVLESFASTLQRYFTKLYKFRYFEEIRHIKPYYSILSSEGFYLMALPLKNTFSFFKFWNSLFRIIARQTGIKDPAYSMDSFDINRDVNPDYLGRVILDAYRFLGVKAPSVLPIGTGTKDDLTVVLKEAMRNGFDFPYNPNDAYVGWYWLLHEKGNFLRARSKLWDNFKVEVTWTIIPSLILIAIAIPSFTLLYSLEPTIFYDSNTIFVKIIGHQWYWSYEFPKETFVLLKKKGNLPENMEMEFSSYMLPNDQLVKGMPRLLSVDNPLYLPTKCNIVIRVTAEDVIHSWAVPSLGVKIDCIPGRINEFIFRIRSPGDLYGQCSELCGVNHGFMPIHIISYDI